MDDGFGESFAAARQQLAPEMEREEASAPEAADCPVKPLGHRNGNFYFFDPAGQLRELGAQALGQQQQIVGLFGDRVDWVITHFEQNDKDGNGTGWFSARRVNRWLVAQCYAEGLFRPDELRRGLGVWQADGALLLHLGHEVRNLTAGTVTPAGFRAFGALWPAEPRAPAPAEEAADATAAQRLEAALGRWDWEQPGAASVFFGLWAAGLLGAATRWRPHGLVVGPAGSGKTTLMELYSATSPLALYWNDYTEAGLRQSLTGRAGPLVLDEAEGDQEGASKLQRVVELLRRASSGEGAQAVRGSSGGKSQTFSVTCSAILGGILPPELLPQDASRITRLDLLPRQEGGAGLPPAEERAALRELAPALWKRALEGLPRFAENLRHLHAELLRRGCAPRLCDQVGTILAARAMMLCDAPLTAADAAEEVDAFAWLAPSAAEQMDDSGPAVCFRHLLASPADVTRHGERPTIRQLILEARGQGDNDAGAGAANRILEAHGIKVASHPQRPDPGQAPGPLRLYVCDKHPRLAGIFSGTQWAGNRWKEDLRRLPGSTVPKHPQNVGGKNRCTVIAAELVPRERAPAASQAEVEQIAAELRRDAAWILAALRGGLTVAEARADAAASAPPVEEKPAGPASLDELEALAMEHHLPPQWVLDCLRMRLTPAVARQAAAKPRR